jgi:glycine oxidase
MNRAAAGGGTLLLVGIAGAGLLGRLLAHQLSAAGHRVEVFDPARCDGPPVHSGSHAAGWTAAGMLSPVAELERAGPEVFALGLRSCALWPGIVASLANPPSLLMRGSLLLAHRVDAGAAMRIVNLLQARAQAAYLPRALSRAELSDMEPAVHGPSLAWLLPCEGQIDAAHAMQALAAQASVQGAHWHWGQRVTDLQPGLMTVESGESTTHQRFDHVFDVRGTGAQPDLPVRGVRGEVIWLHAPGVPLQRPIRLMHPRQPVYLVPRPGDLVVVGASEIESGDRSPISLRSTLELLSAAHSVLPELAEARIVHTESSLRPALPDNLPLLEHTGGLTRINGLYRHGWLIAPALVEQALQALQLHTAELAHHA